MTIRCTGEYSATSRLRFAHTSPIYVTVAGRGAAVPQSFAEAERMLDAFEAFAKRSASPEFLPALLKDVNAARAKLESGTPVSR